MSTTLPRRLSWETRRRVTAMFLWAGWGGSIGAIAFVVALGGLLMVQRTTKQGAVLTARIQSAASVAPSRTVPLASAASDLARFQAFLLPHDDIPDTLKRLLILAEDRGVSLASGEYRAQVEEGFLAYRMSLPVKGDSAAVQNFLFAALEQHPTLALEGATFRRERIEASDIEMRLRLLLLTRLPNIPATSRTP